jgi:hypothetical protein
MQNIGLVFLVFSFVLALIAAFAGPAVWPRVPHLGWLAFAFFVAAELFGGLSRAGVLGH